MPNGFHELPEVEIRPGDATKGYIHPQAETVIGGAINILAAEESTVIKQQVKLRADWNKAHINDNPEQVRRNIETIIACYSAFEF